MADDGFDLEELRKRAESIGLTSLSDAHLRQLAKADKAAQERRDRIPTDLHMYDEPAHTFRADGKT
jgi:hypothetical protein